MRYAHASRWSNRLVRVVATADEGRAREAVRLVVDGVRPSSEAGPDAATNLAALCDALETSPDARRTLARLVRELPSRTHAVPALAESGIPSNEGFITELWSRIERRVLPPVPDPGDLRELVRALFPRRNDHLWVAGIPESGWRRLLTLLDVTADSFPGVGEELALSIRILAHHVSSLGLSPEITSRLPDLERVDSPFLRLGHEVLGYLESFDDDVEGDEEPLLEQTLATVARCRAAVQRLRAEKHEHGTSLHLTSLSFRLLALIDRLDLLLHLTEPVERDFQGSAVRLCRELVQAEGTRDHLVPHLRSSADLLAFQMVEHAARKGSKYIASGRSEYGRFLRSSMGGGLIVALFAMAKVAMGAWTLPLGVEALLYGINYSLCFVLIYLTGATLATKQPAMTANTIARSLGEEGHDLSGLEELVVRVWRSQFVSFVGNLVVAFPVAILVALAVFELGGAPLAGPEKAHSLLEGLHPWRSGALVYAAVAGVLLFLAGLVSGWVDNRLIFRRVPDRVAHHPLAVRTLGAAGARRVADALGAKLGVVVGNVFLGFGLGSMGTLGEILGLPLDIRHIAFASAQFGSSLHVLDYQVETAFIAQIALGVALIGLVNFLVSFGLSLAVALESRGVTFGETRRLLVHLLARLRRRPLDWFVPPAAR